MASSSSEVSEDLTNYDLVWKRISDEDEVWRGSGQRDSDGYLEIDRAPLASPNIDPQISASSSTPMVALPPSTASSPQTLPSTSTLMIATFNCGAWGATFTCEFDQTSRSYKNFNLVRGSMSGEFWSVFTNEANWGK